MGKKTRSINNVTITFEGLIVTLISTYFPLDSPYPTFFAVHLVGIVYVLTVFRPNNLGGKVL